MRNRFAGHDLCVWVSACVCVGLGTCMAVCKVLRICDKGVCVCAWLFAQWRGSVRRYLVSRSENRGVFYLFLEETPCKNSNSGPWEEAKSNNFAPLKNALMPYVNREAGRSFFWDLFGSNI